MSGSATATHPSHNKPADAKPAASASTSSDSAEKPVKEKVVNAKLEAARGAYKAALAVFAEAKSKVQSTRATFREEAAADRASRARKPAESAS